MQSSEKTARQKKLERGEVFPLKAWRFYIKPCLFLASISSLMMLAVLIALVLRRAVPMYFEIQRRICQALSQSACRDGDVRAARIKKPSSMCFS